MDPDFGANRNDYLDLLRISLRTAVEQMAAFLAVGSLILPFRLISCRSTSWLQTQNLPEHGPKRVMIIDK
jgi:hypothetical protein